MIMIEEVNGRWVCAECGREWSAMSGDNEIPETCDCKNKEITND
jgi:hypothetical protein